MLLQFNFSNFKSFRDDTTLDLTATKMSEYSERVVTVGKEKILPISAIFGANAHGKSNVLEALRYMHNYVVYSFDFGGDTDNRKLKRNFYKPTPFLFDEESKNAESSFEVYFVETEQQSGKTYNYGFTVNKDGVTEEWLNYKTKSSKDFKRMFYRNEEEQELDLSGLPVNSRENINVSLEKETLIVSLGAKLKIQKLKHIRDWFLSNEFADFGRPVENYFLSKLVPENFVDDKTVQKKVVDYLSMFDDSIIGFEVEEVKSEDEEDAQIKIDAIHRMIDSDKTTKIPLQNESSGTLKMFALYPMLQNVLEYGGVFVVDELNARLHPLLVRAFLIFFLDPNINKNHAQLIFTTHDSWQLNGNGLRRDEIWFTEKDSKGISVLYSLADFVDEDGLKIRKDENYEKNYLLGKYGAIPTLKSINMLGAE